MKKLGLRKMKKENDLIKAFTGSEIAVNLLRAELEETGIPSMVKNDFQSGVSAGFASGIPSAIDLYINESDLKEAEPIVKEFLRNNK